ncbi:MAG: CARDB domain-containing protein [Spirochaetales bacterium]|uniref:CARDB domain-containing protein n=1 Tax=Candidatus Thalassospirochaeta sargassi TaxID=3119039 RepID=A0AAJ1IA07_9SPIO|nr:CARDB domain-containing protein [Spirochaetales bacterium]
MIKKLSILAAVVLTAIVLTSCPAVLTTDLPSDIMVTLGLINAVEGSTELRTGVGGVVTVPVYISSTGSSTATSFEVTFRLEDDSDLTTAGVNIGTQTVTVGTETMLDLAIPAEVTDANAATYTELYAYFTAPADDPGYEVDDEILNVAMAPIAISTAANYLPDLKIAFVDPESMFRAAESEFPLSFKISNEGNKSVGSGTAVPVEFTVDIDGTDVEVGDVSVTLSETLYPDGFVTSNVTITLPTLEQMATDNGTTVDDLEDWSGTLTGTVDPLTTAEPVNGAIEELDEDDTDTVTIYSGTEKPDLSIGSLDVAESAIVGGPVEIAFTVENDGYASASSGTYGVMLFHDVAGDGSYDSINDTAIYEWAAADCPAVPWDKDGSGENDVLFTTLTIDNLNYPATITAGTQDIGVRITGTLDEWGAGNDTDYASLQFADKDIDLEPGLISTTFASNVDVSTDVTIPVTLLIKNSGTETIDTDFDVTFYSSDDAILDTGSDTLLNTETVTDSVGIGGVGQVELSANIIFNEDATGFYTIYAVVDSADGVAETDEDNNQVDTAAASPLYILVQDYDDQADIDVNMIMFSGGTEDVDVIAYLYDTAWSSSSGGYYYNLQTGTSYISETLIGGGTHGVRLYNRDATAAITWRIVPSYVTSVNEAYWPDPLISDDQFEDNDSTGTATDLDALGINPFNEWIQSYDTSNYENDYYSFTM